MPGAGAVDDHVGSGSAQVPDGFLRHGGDPDGDELPGPVQPGQTTTIASVGLDPIPGGGRDQ